MKLPRRLAALASMTLFTALATVLLSACGAAAVNEQQPAPPLEINLSADSEKFPTRDGTTLRMVVKPQQDQAEINAHFILTGVATSEDRLLHSWRNVRAGQRLEAAIRIGARAEGEGSVSGVVLLGGGALEVRDVLYLYASQDHAYAGRSLNEIQVTALRDLHDRGKISDLEYQTLAYHFRAGGGATTHSAVVGEGLQPGDVLALTVVFADLCPGREFRATLSASPGLQLVDEIRSAWEVVDGRQQLALRTKVRAERGSTSLVQAEVQLTDNRLCIGGRTRVNASFQVDAGDGGIAVSNLTSPASFGVSLDR